LDNEDRRSVALQTAQDIVCLAIFEHFLIAQMTRKRSRQPELRNNRVHIGNLPPMDMYLSNFTTCFPMIIKPSIVQLDLDNVTDDTLAILNFVVCKPLDYHQLFALPPDDDNALVYTDIYSNLATVATNTISTSGFSTGKSTFYVFFSTFPTTHQSTNSPTQRMAPRPPSDPSSLHISQSMSRNVMSMPSTQEKREFTKFDTLSDFRRIPILSTAKRGTDSTTSLK
jgi:hypothetical protein